MIMQNGITEQILYKVNWDQHSNNRLKLVNDHDFTCWKPTNSYLEFVVDM